MLSARRVIVSSPVRYHVRGKSHCSMDDSGVFLMSTSGQGSPLTTTGSSAVLELADHEHLLCLEDGQTLSPEEGEDYRKVETKATSTCKRSFHEVEGECVPPLNTPIKKRRMSKPRVSLVDTNPIQLPLFLEQGLYRSINVIGPDASSKEIGIEERVLTSDHYNIGFEGYEMDIYLHRRAIELEYLAVECLSNQPQINAKMRGVLVDWLAQLCRRFSFAQDTLFLTVNVLDRFLVTTPICRDIFQLLGITSLLVSAKQEEQYPPEIADLLTLCDEAYSRDQVKQMERVILSRLQFKMLAPTAQFFLEHQCSNRLRSIFEVPLGEFERIRSLARYLLEVSLQDYSLCQYAPSLLAVSTAKIANESLFPHIERGKRCTYTGGHSVQASNACMAMLRDMATVCFQRGLEVHMIHDRYKNLYTTDNH